MFGPGDEVAERRGQHALLRSRLHMGSGARVQRVVQRALAGEPVTISVLGGSGESLRYNDLLCKLSLLITSLGMPRRGR